MPSLLALSHGTLDPASRFRILQWLPHLRAAGWRIGHRPNRPPRDQPTPAPGLFAKLALLGERRRRRFHRRLDILGAGRADVIWLNRDMLEGDPGWERALLSRNPRLVYDFDDAIYLTDRRGHFPAVCAAAALVIAGNETLAAEARRHARRVEVLPTVIDVPTYAAGTASRAAGEPLRLGWCGSELSIHRTLVPALPMLARLQQRLGFRLVIMSLPRPRIEIEGLAWEFVPWSPAEETRLGTWFDIGLMPLADEPYLKAKCGCKLLQYLACGLPAIASPVGVNARFLAESGGGIAVGKEASWEAAIRRLADGDLRLRLGMSGRGWCEREMSVARWLPFLDGWLSEVARLDR
jgi:glycosyltransferase involved in cell wall biosynthesis